MVAPEVSVLAKVEASPETLLMLAFSFSENLPPDWTDSAARESEARGRVGS